MDNRIRETFNKIHAEEPLKQKTADFLHEKIQWQANKRKKSRLQFTAVCATFALLFIIGGFSYNLYFTPTAFVDIDVNPSIELVINRFGRVIEAEPYNDDGAAILGDINIRHMRYNDAVDKLIGVMAANGYLQQDGLLSITVQTNNDDKKGSMIGSLQLAADSSLQTHYASATTNVFSVSEEIKTHAHENHMTPAKYLAISELQKIDPTATFEDCRDHTISEINQMIQTHGGEHHGDTSESDVTNAPDGFDDCENDENHYSESTPAPLDNVTPRTQNGDREEHGGGHH